MKEDEADYLLTRADVEERFGIPKRFLELVAADGRGPIKVRIGRLVRYRIEDVREWISGHKRDEG